MSKHKPIRAQLNNKGDLKMIKIYVGTYGKYNGGSLEGKWLELPMNEEELQEELEKIGEGEDDPEYMIEDFEIDNGIYFKISETEDLNVLNELAEGLENLSDYEIEILNAYLDEGESIKKALDKVQNRDGFYIEGDTDEDLACNYINEVYGGVEALDRETLERYFDFEGFGRDLAFDAIKTENGYLFDR